ncbi:MAG: glycosyltransferase family 39 protein, partial [Kiritimatiellae bacterium]|nr:glycosyltransferase family 39 protein [Kiritimatiellia bacterium]
DKKTFVLLLILAVGVAMRFYGISFGLPLSLCRPDESTIIDKAWLVFGGDPNPHFFYYPSLLIYLHAALFTIRYLALSAIGTPCDLLANELSFNPTSLFLITRILSAVLGSLTIIITYLTARRMLSRNISLIAAFFMSICYLHVRNSHFGTTDVPMTFFTISAVFFILKSLDTNNIKDYIRAGILTGLAASTKYGGVFLIAPLLAAVGMNIKKITPKTILDRRVLFCMIAAGAAFLLTTPFALFDFKTFIAHFISETRHLSEGQLIWDEPLILERGWWYHARYTLPYGIGFPMFLTAIIGIYISIRKDPKRSTVFYAFPMVFYIFAGKGYTVFVRYMIPVLPFLCIASAAFAAHVTDKISTSARRAWVTVLLIAIIAAQPIHDAVSFNKLIAKQDNRLTTHDWIKENIPPGSTIYQTGKPFGHALLPSTLHRFRMGKKNSLPDYILVHRYTIPASDVPDNIETLLKTDFYPIKNLEAMDMNKKDNWFDQQDAFYLPFTGFKGISRPGPNTTIYKRKPSH